MNELFLKIINMSISASWLILAVLILRLVLKKAPKWVNVLLWGIVAVRLICPFSFESTLSLIPSAETFPEKVISGPSFDIQTGISPVDNRINDYLGDRYFEGVTVPANNGNNIMTILTIVWIIGILLLVAYTIISYRRLHREIDAAVRYKDNIFQSENVSSPFVLGIIKPRIYLPFKMDSQDLEHVVAHEQAHIQRKDHWWKPLGFLLLTIHWFNPLIWLAYVLLCRDIEFACDEKVIKELGNEQRADYTQALVVCSVNRRMIAACPLAFGEVGVKDRVKSVMNYKKPAFWIIILAVIACVIVAVCFLTNPMGFQFDEATHTIVSANHFDMRNADDAVAIEMNPAQISELSSRLARVKNTKKSNEYGGFTPGYQISALLKDGTYIRINGYSFSNNGMVDIEWNGERYVVSDGEFQDYLSRICVGGDVAVAEPVSSVTKWFDYLETPDEMQWDGRHEINLPKFLEVTFRWYPEKIEAVTENAITPLYTGMPIWNTYFCDLTGNGLPELCSTISWGSGMIDNRVTIYDYANGASYELSDRGNFDFTLRFHEADGYLYVDKRKYNTDELVQSGRLVFKDDCLQVESFSSNVDEPAKYYLTIGAEGVKSIELTMPNSSGGFENADGSLLKKGERIWFENLDG